MEECRVQVRVKAVSQQELPEIVSRRQALLGLGSAAIVAGAGCTRSIDMSAIEIPSYQVDDMSTGSIRPKISVDRQVTRPELMYASFTDDGFVLPEIPFKKIEPKWRRQIVVDPTGEAPGTIVVQAAGALPLSTSSRAATRCATASASAATASSGPAAPTSSTARSGRPGRRPPK